MVSLTSISLSLSVTDYSGVLDRVVAITHINIDRLRIGNTSYADQFRDALNVNGGDVDNAGVVDYLLHFITIYFKVGVMCVTDIICRQFLSPRISWRRAIVQLQGKTKYSKLPR